MGSEGNSSTPNPYRNKGRVCSPDIRLHSLGKLGTQSLKEHKTEHWLLTATGRAFLCVHSGPSVHSLHTTICVLMGIQGLFWAFKFTNVFPNPCLFCNLV